MGLLLASDKSQQAPDNVVAREAGRVQVVRVRRLLQRRILPGAVESIAHEDFLEHFGQEPPPAYERLLADALLGDQTLFLHGAEIEASWRYADAVRADWEGPRAPLLHEYEAGSWGPEEADRLFGNCQGSWPRG